MRGWLVGWLLVALSAGVTSAGTVVLEPDRDATLIESPDGSRAIGSAPYLYVGRTAQREGQAIRRALVRFDVSAAVPGNAVIDRVVLEVAVTPGNPGPQTVRLHRLLSDWGEGDSVGFGGGGVPSRPGDATWIHTFWDERTWVRPGGQFVAAVSGEGIFGDPGFYAIEGTSKMIHDVRMWAANPAHNFGWILIGDETLPQSVQVLASREMAIVPLRPRLTIEFHLPPLPDRGVKSLP